MPRRGHRPLREVDVQPRRYFYATRRGAEFQSPAARYYAHGTKLCRDDDLSPFDDEAADAMLHKVSSFEY